VRYIFHVNLHPSLLTQEQVATLPLSLQKRHAHLLKKVAASVTEFNEIGKRKNIKAKTALPAQEAEPAKGVVQYHPPPGTVPPPPGTVPPKQQQYNNTHITTTKKDEKNKKTTREKTDQAVVVALTQKGITKKVAQQLAHRYPASKIFEKVRYLEFLLETKEDINSPAGYLRKAIEDDWAAPAGFTPRAEREAALVAEQEAAQVRERLIDARNQQQRAIEQAQQEQRLKWLKKQRERVGMTTAAVQGLEAAWQATYAELGHQAQFKVRLAESQAITIEQGRVVVAVLNYENQEWCEGRLKPRIAQALARHLAEEITLTFIVFGGLGDEAREGFYQKHGRD
jgi:hypothetical protein